MPASSLDHPTKKTGKMFDCQTLARLLIMLIPINHVGLYRIQPCHHLIISVKLILKVNSLLAYHWKGR